jgi:hypothetical protein
MPKLETISLGDRSLLPRDAGSELSLDATNSMRVREPGVLDLLT